MNFKKSLILILSISTIALICIALFNYKIDPGNIFNYSSQEKQIADILLKQRQNVVVQANFDDRLIKKYCINNMQQSPLVIALGSSRIMSLNQTSLENDDFFNNGVSGASLEDIIAIYFMYENNNLQPQTIILALDPWILNKNNVQTRWQSINKEYYDALDIVDIKHNINNSNIAKYSELISLPYFRASFKKYKSKQLSSFYATTEISTDEMAILLDGSMSYPEKTVALSTEEIDKLATEYTNTTTIYSLGNFYVIDHQLKEQFEKFIKYLKLKKKKVIFFFPPYHPIVYNAISTNPKYENVLKAQLYFQQIALENDIKTIASYNPYENNFSSKDFFDGMHMQPTSINQLFQHELSKIR